MYVHDLTDKNQWRKTTDGRKEVNMINKAYNIHATGSRVYSFADTVAV